MIEINIYFAYGKACVETCLHPIVHIIMIINIHHNRDIGKQGRVLSLCGAVCIINSYSTLLNWPIVSLLFLFIFFSMFLQI